jgi:anti-sigma B factor antagonist
MLDRLSTRSYPPERRDTELSEAAVRHVVPLPPSLPPLFAPRGPTVSQPGPTRFPAPGAGAFPGDRPGVPERAPKARPEDRAVLKVWSVVAADVCTVTVSGEVDCLTAPGLQDALEEVLDRPDVPRRVVLDLSRVTFLGAAGLAVLALTHHTAASTGREVSVRCGTARAVIRPLQITGLWSAFHIIDHRRPGGRC